MIESLMDVSQTRDRKQAALFYVFYSVLLFILAAGIAGILGGLGLLGDSNEEINKNSRVVGWVVTPLFCIGLSAWVAAQKRIMDNVNTALVFLAGILALLSGFLGMLVPAYLTTKERDDAGRTGHG